MSGGLASDLKIEGAQFPSAMEPRLRSGVDNFQRAALIVGLIALGLTAYGAFAERDQFFFSYLFGFLFWLQLSLGCFLVTMIHYLTGGRWGYPTRRFMEAGFMVLPLLFLLFIPIFFGLHNLYPWARPAEVASSKVLQERAGYQSSWAFIVRVVFFLGVWIWMAWMLRRWSLRQDATDDAEPTRKARLLSGPGIVVYCLLSTFAHIDWIMSLEKHWFSTMFAVIVIIGQILLAIAFSVVMLSLFRKQQPLSQVVSKSQYHQLGNLLLAFVMFWTYVSFGQLLIIYSGDLPHELDWYLHRIATTWKAVVVALAVLHFFVPFYLLLFRAVSKNVAPLTILAVMLLIMHILSVYWMVMPTFHQDGVRVSWLDFTAPIGVGGLWVAAFLAHLKGAPLLLQHDPGLQFAFKYGS